MASAPQELFSDIAPRTGRDEGTAKSGERRLSHLQALEAESIHILREAAAEFSQPVMLYSIGKDSSVMLRLAQKAFYPGKIPFPLLHVDTSYKFPEMIKFRNEYPKQIGAELIVHQNREALETGANPFLLGTQKCCGLLKTKSLLDALAEGGFNVLIYSKDQLQLGEKSQSIKCRMRSLGCVPCTGAIRSEADTVPKIIAEMISFRRSERENRAIDHDEEASMEIKKREGYF